MRMRTRFNSFAKALIGTTLAALVASPSGAEDPEVRHHQYELIDVGTLGGTFTFGSVMNERGEVAGFAALPGDASHHAFRFNGKVIEDLGTLGGANSDGVSINHRGQVTGSADTAAGLSHAFVSDPGEAIKDLGTLGGTQSTGNSINDAGQITGSANTTGDAATRAFLYSGGTMIDLGTLGGNNSTGNAINSAGQVAGAADIPPGFYSRFHAFVSHGGSPLIDLGTLGNPTVEVSSANLINSAGQVAGNSTIFGQGNAHAFLYENGAMTDLGALGNVDSIAAAINNSNQITGYSQNGSPVTYHAFLYANGSMKDLGTLGPSCGLCDRSFGFAINDFGEVAGQDDAIGTGFDTPRAFVYSHGRMIDLNSLLSDRDARLYTLVDAVAINNVGQVLVHGVVNSTNDLHSFVLTCHPRGHCKGFISNDD